MHPAYVVVTTIHLRLLVNVRGYVRPVTYTFVVVAWFDFRLKTLVATVWPTTTFDLHFWSIDQRRNTSVTHIFNYARRSPQRRDPEDLYELTGQTAARELSSGPGGEWYAPKALYSLRWLAWISGRPVSMSQPCQKSWKR